MGTSDAAVSTVIDRRFEALIFDWDGTAVPDRGSDAGTVRDLVESLCRAGMHVAIVSGTHVGNVDGQLQARPEGPGELLLALNRGSEIYAVDRDGPRLIERRTATPSEDTALDDAAARTVTALAACGLHTEIVSQRLNRRKIDLIPEPGWHDPPKAEIDRLVDAVVARLHSVGLGGLPEVVTIAQTAAAAAGISDPRVTSDAKHVEIGLTDKSDSSRWIFEFLSRAGVGPGHVLIAGDEFGALGGVRGSDSMMMIKEAGRSTVLSVGREPSGVPANVVHLGGGPEQFMALLRDQLQRRVRGDVPDVDEDPEWTIVVDGYDREHERAAQAVLTIADGDIGTRGCSLVHDGNATPAVVAAGVYHGTGPETTLAACPLWHQITTTEPASSKALRRVLDLRTFMLHESHREDSTTYRALRLSSLARPGTVALRADGPTGNARVCPPLMIPDDSPAVTGTDGDRVWMSIESSEGGVTAAATQRDRPQPDRAPAIERLGVFVTDAHHVPSPSEALERLDEVEKIGFDQLVDEHRRAWARRWHDAQITIDGDPRTQRAARFALAHLLASAADHDEAAVGARGLTGPAYRGHVFWDADVFVLPALAATNPRAARSMLEYRARRLRAARSAAHAEGRDGARFPWESARTGRDVTPRQAVDRRGRVMAIRTGALEVHIVGCVAWACSTYLDWTGDTDFAAGAGADIIAETARYWTSRVRVADDGRAHICGVIGPDEYHEPVDDNAFTNVLARWNLRRAAALETPAVTGEERDRWWSLADSLVDGYNADTGRYEQFAGFDALDPVIIAEVATRRPIAADLLLGTELVRRSQIVKQADVLMLHHMLPDEVAVGSLEPNLTYYEPRTAHGSSLSPGIHASLFARAGRTDEALALLDIAGHIDLDDITDTTAGGLHVATMGSMWQALAFGFMGLRAEDQALEIDPRIPERWSALEMHCRYHDTRITVRAEPHAFAVSAESPVTVRVGGHVEFVGERGLNFERKGERWLRAPSRDPKEPR